MLVEFVIILIIFGSLWVVGRAMWGSVHSYLNEYSALQAQQDLIDQRYREGQRAIDQLRDDYEALGRRKRETSGVFRIRPRSEEEDEEPCQPA